MQIRRILKPCVACGESLVFGHFTPQGDVLRLNQGWSRVCCPTCHALGPVRSNFHDACESWNGLAASGRAATVCAQPLRCLPPRPARDDPAAPAAPY